jgi:hypothetical protein
MTDPQLEAPVLNTELHAKVTAIIRDDLAREAANGFPFVSTFPNSETFGIPKYFDSLDVAEREKLLDALAHYSILPFSHEIVKEKQTNPVLHKYLRKQPYYGTSYGAGRPSKATLKKRLIAYFTEKGFTCEKDGWVIRFYGKVGDIDATVKMFLDPGLMRQLDFSVGGWMKDDLREQLMTLAVPWTNMLGQVLTHDPPIIDRLSYDTIWTGSQGSSVATCWDLIQEQNLEEILNLFPSILERTSQLATCINALSTL